MDILTLQHQKYKKLLLRLFSLQFIKMMLFNIMLKSFLTSCLSYSKVRGQHRIRIFVQHLFFDKEHLIFGMMSACELN